MVQLTDQPINTEMLHKELLKGSESFGGVSLFEGRVRNHSHGKTVISLFYECYQPMALKIMEEIRQEALSKWKAVKIMAVHRYGPIPLGESAVWIGVAAAHRDESFAACRFMIDEIKSRVPIWKKEEYADGTYVWAHQKC
ncbi:MAG TPA: molybdenum cofactor biosynthesis protein MoaE [bacterium]|nr:molybdenum cofactor biosynthesis protein MoaE [bacterium]